MPSAPPSTLPLLRILSWPPLGEAARAALTASSAGPFDLIVAEDAADAVRRLQAEEADVALVSIELLDAAAGLAKLAEHITVVLQSGADVDQPFADPAAWIEASQRGVQDILSLSDQASAGAGRRLRAATVRHRLLREARTAYATDLSTGLPHQQQLLEHMSHLLALREREPAPMALLVLRVEGLATTEARLGPEAAGALRRKLAVRLRSGLRASDVVASIGRDSFAILLAWIDAAADVDGVAAKLVNSVQRPFSLSGQPVALAVSVGSRRYPEDGKDAETLLQGAVAQAAGLPGQGRAGFVNHLEHRAAPAANDD